MPKLLIVVTLGLLVSVSVAPRLVASVTQEARDPATVITLADVEAVLSGKFGPRVVEPGVIFYEEIGGARVVDVSLSYAIPGRGVAEVRTELEHNDETVEDVPGLGSAAMYRPRANNATVQKADKAGDMQWLEIRVHNVEGNSVAADTKRFAIELARRGLAKL